jgi:hypothetical protein
VEKMQRSVLVPAIVVLAAVAIAGTLTAMPTSAQASSGQFNPQTQFAVGSKLQITSIYGLETVPPPFYNGAGFNYGSHAGGGYSYGNHNQTSRNNLANQQWNLTYLRNIPTANSSITINVQVMNDTEDDGIMWIVQGGSITYNGTSLAITGGLGGIGKLNRVLSIGNATDSGGNTFRWSLQGLASLYEGTVIVSLTGNVAQSNQNATLGAPTRPNSPLLRGLSLTYIATIS